jgi:hypothetical protein
MSREVLFVVGSTELDKSDELILAHLTERLLYDVEVIAGRNMLNHHLMNKELVVLSSTAAQFGDAANVIKILWDAPIPVMVLGTKLLKGMKMALEAYAKTELIDYTIKMGGGYHPLTAWLKDEVTISKAKRELFLVQPYKSFYEIACLKLNEEQKSVLADRWQNTEELRSVCLYAYEAGDIMFVEGRNKEKLNLKGIEEKLKRKEAIEITAPARRVAYVFNSKTAAEATAEGWILFEAAARWAISLKTPDEIIAEEANEIKSRREDLKNEKDEVVREGCYQEAECGIKNGSLPENLVGLALSGGGIRSATFSLGLLQGFHQKGLLRIFDYLSTVSGGGFVGGWWSAWLSRQDTKGIFPSQEKLEPYRADHYLGNRKSNRQPEGSMCVEHDDPIHHLRLFSNYLTPRKGALSTDTWGGVVYISRNLALTWLSLLPILFSFVLLGQFYFLLQKNSAYEYLYPFRNEIVEYENRKAALPLEYAEWLNREGASLSDEEKQDVEAERDEELQTLNDDLKRTQSEYDAALWNRAYSSRFVLLPIVGWIILMSMAWLRSNVTRRPLLDWLAHSFASVVLILLFFCILCLINPEMWGFTELKGYLANWKYSLALWLAVGFGFYFLSFPWKVEEPEWRKEIRKNKVSQIHAGLMIGLAIATFFLALSAYGYDFANYIWFDSMRQGHIAAYVAKAGGVLTLIFSILGSIFTAVKSAPAGGEDKNTASHMTDKSRFILSITPPLVLVTLTVILSWFARHCIYSLTKISDTPYATNVGFAEELAGTVNTHEQRLMMTVILSIILGFFFAIYELKKWNGWVKPLLGFSLLLSLCAASGWLITFIPNDKTVRELSYWKWHWLTLFTAAFFVGAILCFRLFLFRKQRLRKFNEFSIARQILIAFTIALAFAVILAFLSYWMIDRAITKGLFNPPSVDWLRSSLSMAGILFCGIAVSMEMGLSMKNTGRSVYLMLGSYVILVAFLLSSFFSSPTEHLEISLAYLTMALLTLALGWTIAIGWMSDPNWLSMHLFYKARLVRSYLGASNPLRKVEEITQSAIGDDVLMYELNNCKKGAPYHLVNTTLNLIGAKDLATAQRSSSYFVVSKLYCGSLRTGYRSTKEYMDRRFSLGTAVSVSGAAISPNMGAKTQTAALSMLMTLLNVRLGFWSPTPNNGSWRSPNPRLWPFYTLREFLSQTNDLGSYCYLTDGGHFDNTGLYSLVERACRYIIVSDNGADPLPCFEDLGDAIRRCRIDFGTEIELDTSPFFTKKDETSGDSLAQTHYVVGTIEYSDAHLKKLGWTVEDRKSRSKGIIILIKPSLLADETADLRQYARQNKGFPHQSTSDQWFDEAQFESYRRLGEHCAESLYEELKFSELLESKHQPEKLTPQLVQEVFQTAKVEFEKRMKKKEPKPSLTVKRYKKPLPAPGRYPTNGEQREQNGKEAIEVTSSTASTTDKERQK